MNENTTQIIPFFFGTKEIRSVLIDGEPWFVAKDVCDVLDLENVTKAVESLDEDELTLLQVRAGGQRREMNCVNESGLYALIFKSRKPQARAFRKWVTSEVLPALRKHGHYETPGHRRESRAHIFHHRGPVSRTGLDIRYTLDLTKIALNPEPHSLELVQRLTGVDLEDLTAELEARRALTEDRSAADIAAYCDECLEDAPGHSEGSTTLYRAFCRWFEEKYRAASRRPETPSQKRFGRRLMALGYPRRRTTGGSRYEGVALRA